MNSFVVLGGRRKKGNAPILIETLTEHAHIVTEQLFPLIQHHIIDRHEIYTISQIWSFYSELSGNTCSANIRSMDLKKMLIDKFGEYLKFSKPNYLIGSKTSEYVMSSDEELPNFMQR